MKNYCSIITIHFQKNGKLTLKMVGRAYSENYVLYFNWHTFKLMKNVDHLTCLCSFTADKWLSLDSRSSFESCISNNVIKTNFLHFKFMVTEGSYSFSRCFGQDGSLEMCNGLFCLFMLMIKIINWNIHDRVWVPK